MTTAITSLRDNDLLLSVAAVPSPVVTEITVVVAIEIVVGTKTVVGIIEIVGAAVTRERLAVAEELWVAPLVDEDPNEF